MSERSSNAVLNSTISFISQFIILVTAFVVRKKIVVIMGIEIIGLNGVLNEIIAMFSLAELGIATSIIFRLYQPISTNNIGDICKYFTFLKRAYHIIGGFILFCGILCMPFIHLFIKLETIGTTYINFAFIVLVVGTALSFSISSYRTIFIVNQRQYFCGNLDTILYVVFTIMQIYAIVNIKSFILYLLLHQIRSLSANILIMIFCYNKYPFLKQKQSIQKSEYQEIFKDIKDISISRIAGYIYSSTDNIIISTICGTITVGFVSNYKCILTPIRTVINTINAALIPSWGNYINEKNDTNMIYVLFKRYNFLQFVFVSVILVPCTVLIDKFIILWLGNEYIMARSISLLMIMDIFINALQEPNVTIMNVVGMFKENRIISELSTLVNLVISILLAFNHGAIGVLIGTIVALILFWIGRNYFVFKYFFKHKKQAYITYWKKNLIYTFNFLLQIIFLNIILSNIVVKSKIIEFAIWGIISVLFVCFTNLFMWYKTEEGQYTLRLIKNIIISKKKDKSAK